ncbi:MAG: aminotransferase class IV [Prevotella sp.]|jgi:4-amino-4-deoxychorismate lyase|nr:aminotransferase class IV [Prevotella sp.]
MKQPVFTEALKILDGKFCNLPFHQERIFRTSKTFFEKPARIDLSESDIPLEYRNGIVKCRIIYSGHVIGIEYQHYKFRTIRKLKLVVDDAIDYSFKYADRHDIDNLLSRKHECDDILIVKNGCITDTSFSNVVFRNESGLYTPASYLLAGTKRRLLLEQGIIQEKEIKAEDIKEYSRLYIINTMIDLEDNVSLDTSDLI